MMQTLKYPQIFWTPCWRELVQSSRAVLMVHAHTPAITLSAAHARVVKTKREDNAEVLQFGGWIFKFELKQFDRKNYRY